MKSLEIKKNELELKESLYYILTEFNMLKVINSEDTLYRDMIINIPNFIYKDKRLSNHIRMIKEFVSKTNHLINSYDLSKQNELNNYKKEYTLKYIYHLYYSNIQNRVYKEIEKKYFNKKSFLKINCKYKDVSYYKKYIEHIQKIFLYIDSEKEFTGLKVNILNNRLGIKLNLKDNNEIKEVTQVIKDLSLVTIGNWYSKML